MADVRSDEGTTGSSRVPGNDRRGQMMVVMSLVLAMLFVAMALYLNTAIYTENQATQQADIAGAEGAVSYAEAVEVGVGGAIEHVNEYNHTDVDAEVNDYDDMVTVLEADVEEWSGLTQQLEATRARSTNTSLQGASEGIRIVQDDPQTFENDNAANPENWTVVETENVRAYEMYVTDQRLVEADPADVHSAADAFSVDYDGTRHMYVHQYGDAITVTVTDSGGNDLGSCGISGNPDWVVIDVTGAELEGPDSATERCPVLHEEVFGTMSGAFEISHENASSVEGTYELVAEEPIAVGPYYDFGDGNSPYTTTAVYSADVHVVYETPRISYATELRVAPGEPDV